jgi:hypothetical protein
VNPRSNYSAVFSPNSPPITRFFRPNVTQRPVLITMVEYLYHLILTFVGSGARALSNNKESNQNVRLLSSQPPIFVLCESCHWCATYLDKTRIPYNECPHCSSDMLSSFPILSTEAFTFDYSEKRGVELEFRRRQRS